jgi:hypothetical protein
LSSAPTAHALAARFRGDPRRVGHPYEGQWLAPINYDNGIISSVDDIPQNTIVPMDCINSNGGRQQTQCSDGMCTGTGIRAQIACFIERTFTISCAAAQANCENAGGTFVSPETPNQN